MPCCLIQVCVRQQWDEFDILHWVDQSNWAITGAYQMVQIWSNTVSQTLIKMRSLQSLCLQYQLKRRSCPGRLSLSTIIGSTSSSVVTEVWVENPCIFHLGYNWVFVTFRSSFERLASENLLRLHRSYSPALSICGVMV